MLRAQNGYKEQRRELTNSHTQSTCRD
jgi:hypothetical protein